MGVKSTVCLSSLEVGKHSKHRLKDGAEHGGGTEHPRRHQPWVAEVVPPPPCTPLVPAVAAVVLQRHANRVEVVTIVRAKGEPLHEPLEQLAHLGVGAQEVPHDAPPRQQRHVLRLPQELRHERHVRRHVVAGAIGGVPLLVRQDIPENVVGLLVHVLERHPQDAIGELDVQQGPPQACCVVLRVP